MTDVPGEPTERFELSVELQRTLSDLSPDNTYGPHPSESGASLGMSLGDLHSDGESSSAAKAAVTLGEAIGRGGMADVYTGTQIGLSREIAVKRPRADKSSVAGRRAWAAFIQESLITARLEHPGIIPIHDLVYDETRRPMLVMKRIIGQNWSKLVAKRPGDLNSSAFEDYLTRQLGVLVQVCHALEFAHSRGVIHQDIKPSNVMVGEFGEVYLVDWGIAQELTADRSPAGPKDQIVGTPAYMAPEMIDERLGRPDVRTDVFLLGSVLYKLLSGRSPYFRAKTAAEAIMAAHKCRPPEYPEELPEGLVSICNAAMQRAQSDRTEDARSFRESIEAFLAQRPSVQLEETTTQRLEELKEHIAEARVAEAQARGTDTAFTPPNELYGLYRQCRFGFREALRLWGENERAQRGLESCLSQMLEFELARRSYPSAVLLFEEVSIPSSTQRQALESLQQEYSEDRNRQERLDGLVQDLDPSVGGGFRARFTVVMATAWALIPLLTQWALGDDPEAWSPAWFIVPPFVFAAGVAAVAWITRRELLQTSFNRRVIRAFVLCFFTMGIFHGLAEATGLSVVATLPFDLLVIFLTCGVLAATVDVRVWPTALLYLLASFLVVAAPDAVFEITSVANLAAGLILAWVWRSAPPAS